MAEESETGHRIVYCQDAMEWLESGPILSGCSLVASLPDYSEFSGYSLAEWKKWFVQAATLILSRCPPDGVTIFFQSDIKFQGTWVDKGFLCQKAAEALGHELLWHKIICSAPPGITTFGRPSYSHLLCFSQDLRLPIKCSVADVLADRGEKVWQRGMGLEACLLAVRFIAEQTQTRTIVNPFCGHGSVLATANALGLKAIGIEKNRKRVDKARRLQLHLAKGQKRWEIAGP